MKHLFIINPAAGSRDRTAEYTAQIHRLCQGLDYEIAVSQAPGECRRLAREAAETGENVRIYACGGDGTLNEIASGAAGFPNAAVTAFSGGSGNDFVRLFSEPAAFSQLSRLLDAEETAFDLIACNDDLALNVCSVGLDARIGTDVARYKRFPFLHGFNAYALSTVVNLFRGISEHYIVEINGERIDGSQTFVCACNGRYYGGGFNPVPEADPADGKLDVLLVKKVRLWQVPGIIGKYKNGRYRELPEFIRHFRTDRVRVICDRPSAVNLDGELRIAEDIEISVAREKIHFFYPRGLHWAAESEIITK
ncbi:MAG: diacylglycerol kinase family protein [Firmicutes bacterium]|nr:lipid kinase [Clostridiales bacterium]MDD5882714.1 diacylglycerol kinase family protein [Bacillota bacterium]